MKNTFFLNSLSAKINTHPPPHNTLIPLKKRNEVNKTCDFPNNMPNLDRLSEAWDGSWLWKCFDHSPTPSHIPWWKNLWIFLVIGVQWANSGLWELLKKGSRVFVDAFVSLKFATYICLYIHFIVCYVHMFVYTYVCTCIHVCVHVYIHTYVHACIICA